MDFDDLEEDDDDIINLVKNSDINDFVHTDEEKIKTVSYESLTIVDALSMANDAWSNGAPFDVDVRIVNDIVESDPARIVSKEEYSFNDTMMYCVWALVSVKSADYPVAVRFYADKEEFDSKAFQWSIDQPVNSICLSAIVEVFKYREKERWSNLLDSDL